LVEQLVCIEPIEVKTLCKVGDVCFELGLLGKVFEQLLHILVEFLLEVLQNCRVVVLGNVLLDECTFFFFLDASSLQPRHKLLLTVFALGFFIVHVIVPGLCSLDDLLVFHVVEETDDHTAEEQRADVYRCDYSEQVLIRQKTLFKAFIKEVAVEQYNFIDSLDLFQLFLQLAMVRLKHLILHVVHVVLAELEHPVS